ncbi:hypothetical protein EIN_052630 [Entamoeba invadens IP1]|uniref:hypothetical protein n=1 Tax=Entamoeba invadens IP1 TaxID=370355 RepID=UPI0002C3DA4B|nr:hypothetical protein EIN_052630 [Entamoeba invadens IP1]ELP93048.1 hypothetical protein EIN_052630 [Entamoeba invadens IP1]|eukprot:XP_004259819.1 hypothetical protein EIN_052630 [Entamoeba invadens IP1]
MTTVHITRKRIQIGCSKPTNKTGRVRWQWFDGKLFIDYPDNQNIKIEEAFSNNEHTFKIDEYRVIDFSSMTQIRIDFSNRSRRIRRYIDEATAKRNEAEKIQKMKEKKEEEDQLAEQKKRTKYDFLTKVDIPTKKKKKVSTVSTNKQEDGQHMFVEPDIDVVKSGCTNEEEESLKNDLMKAPSTFEITKSITEDKDQLFSEEIDAFLMEEDNKTETKEKEELNKTDGSQKMEEEQVNDDLLEQYATLYDMIEYLRTPVLGSSTFLIDKSKLFLSGEVIRVIGDIEQTMQTICEGLGAQFVQKYCSSVNLFVIGANPKKAYVKKCFEKGLPVVSMAWLDECLKLQKSVEKELFLYTY